ncbi:hypothetical protein LCGC14_0993380 [marine sediment metagenome]|uniref:Uncharacterized protein n=1 Tax=marine sediment metagenome TaxID=412755 RepID=A0A0F9N9R0_9ZZZZ
MVIELCGDCDYYDNEGTDGMAECFRLPPIDMKDKCMVSRNRRSCGEFKPKSAVLPEAE